MDDSNFRSILVALDHLGYAMVPIEVSISGVLETVPAASVLKQGDIIVTVNGTPVGSAQEIRDLMAGLAPGDILDMVVKRGGEEISLSVELAEREDTPGAPMIGVELDELKAPPFPILIRTGSIGGPSA